MELRAVSIFIEDTLARLEEHRSKLPRLFRDMSRSHLPKTLRFALYGARFGAWGLKAGRIRAKLPPDLRQLQRQLDAQALDDAVNSGAG